jgi:gluconolactonase
VTPRRLAALALLPLAAAFSQTIEKLDPALDRILPPDAKLERVATGFNRWTEGPVWVRTGCLLFAEIPSNNIDEWCPGHKATVFLHPSGYKGSAPFHGPEPGSNGMTLDSRGRVTVAGHAQRDVFRLETLSPHARITILADTYEGKRLNSPNDLVYKSDGSLYFTDPPYGLETQGDKDPKKELKVDGVYRIAGARDHKPGAPPDHGKLQLIISDLARPNGIAFSPDEKYLYIAVSGPKIWMRYRVQPDGSVADGKVFCDAQAAKEPGGPDGMKVDERGNIYSAGPGGLWIISPEGKHVGTIHTPEVVANEAFGGADRRTLYITASTSLYRIKLKIPGEPFR